MPPKRKSKSASKSVSKSASKSVSKSASKEKSAVSTTHEQPQVSAIRIMSVTSGNVNSANEKLMRGHSMVEFFHPNCGHCQTLKPEWEKMCFTLNKDYKGDATIAAVDCSDQEMLSQLKVEKSFQGFPTILHMLDGNSVQEYQGDRTEPALIEFAESKLPISKTSEQLEPASISGLGLSREGARSRRFFPLSLSRKGRKTTKRTRRRTAKASKSTKKPVKKSVKKPVKKSVKKSVKK